MPPASGDTSDPPVPLGRITVERGPRDEQVVAVRRPGSELAKLWSDPAFVRAVRTHHPDVVVRTELGSETLL
jgi:hypothetical protein